LDFDNIVYGSKLFDLSHSIMSFCRKGKGIDIKRYQLFIKQYKKYGSLSKKEIEMIPYFILREGVDDFWWIYNGVNKDIPDKDSYIKSNIDFTKNLIKDFRLFKWN